MPDALEEVGIARLTLSAPPLNILTRAVLADVRARLRQLEADSRVRVLLLAAEGPHFSAGADVGEHLPPECDVMIPEFGATARALHDFPLPVLAMVRGRCLGGAFELVQACDIVVAADDALFGQPEIRLGVFPPVACALLGPALGAALAAELLYTGDSLTAAEAEAAGLVRSVVPADELEDAAAALAGRIARHSAAALRSTKRALRAAAAVPAGQGIELATRIYLDDLMATADAVEGLTAFLEKRRPEWRHA
ncbi:MAG TPA: enoyl-CoA hydratase/isomerase family protein [Longimicrobiales bacterium]|nr:enoyl-CoA hydratase/isomerase family protein [Longimicrobiales bacterium]